MKTTSVHGRVPCGIAGMLVVLFALAGVAFSYGLGGHVPPLQACVIHDLAPDQAPPTGPGIVVQDQAHPTPPSPATHPQTYLSLAILLTLVMLGLAAAPLRRGVRPARSGWVVRRPARAPCRARSLAVLQVLRL
ncbi:hypothetical protein [Thermomonospora catenispora]|uniref:hypothetical protein n=1 Tax=Thermomonospora catenispora TaxID=2493090 RepID=UPI001123281A|nr:hypothetical protein [Thermomonospora catenispora]TNY35345.1 hypothetical protein EIO00_19085 [Thermomonospora catenispora]